MKITKEVWGVIGMDGYLVVDAACRSEEDAWKIALGWPTDEEIQYFKDQGCYSVKVTLTYETKEIEKQTSQPG